MADPDRSVTLFRDASLQSRNTFGVPANAAVLAEVGDAVALPALLASAEFSRQPPLVVGGGSNLLFVEDPQPPVLLLTGRNVRVLTESPAEAIVRADGARDQRQVFQSGQAALEGVEYETVPVDPGVRTNDAPCR